MTSLRWISRKLRQELMERLEPKEVETILSSVIHRKANIPKLTTKVKNRIESFAANNLPCVVTHSRKWRVYSLEGYRASQTNAKELHKHRMTV